MANTLNPIIQASDWLKGCGSQVAYESSMLMSKEGMNAAMAVPLKSENSLFCG